MANTRTRSVRGGVSLQEAASKAGVSAGTLRRWAREGLIPQYDGDGNWPPAAVSHARIVARLRERGHPLEDIRRATEEGRLAFGYIDELFPSVDDREYTVRQAARETGLEPALVERVVSALGMNPAQAQSLSSQDVQLLRYVAAVLDAGLPLVAMLQLVRVYGQAMAQVADAEVRGLISEEFLKSLTSRQKDVIRYRFGLNGESPLTLAECAKKVGVTRDRVRQIERRSLDKLKQSVQTSRLVQEIVA